MGYVTHVKERGYNGRGASEKRLMWLSKQEVKDSFFQGGFRRIELDVWIPKLNLALEYQGEQHYYDLNRKRAYTQLAAPAFKQEQNPHTDTEPETTITKTTASIHYLSLPYFTRDKIKEDKCRELNIGLVSIPYWWDQTIESLRELAHECAEMNL